MDVIDVEMDTKWLKQTLETLRVRLICTYPGQSELNADLMSS